ncbi:MAG TPA: S8 family serine peptidase [Candidatus Limnocylindrales bacterium]
MVSRALKVLTGLALLLTALPTGWDPPHGAGGADKIDTALAARFDNGGRSDVLVRFHKRADLSGAAAVKDWAKRGEYVVDRLRAAADASQARTRSRLAGAGVAHQAFWVVNTILVKAAGSELAETLAADPEVSRISEAVRYEVPEPLPGNNTTAAAVNGVEWGVANIGADRVWSEFGARGEGLVVATIDTGVQSDHPALTRQYRGNLGNGGIDHNYNWFDPSRVCGSPSVTPCDNIGHGTHVTGTMVGADTAGNSVGVAPAARWIAAKGCEDRERGCTDAALLASAQWILAPTNLSGTDARPDLRPHIVNNSWGGDTGPVEDPWFDHALRAWNAAGIFAVFSNGNAGPGCDTAGSPADSEFAFSAGAYDSSNRVASFSSRGPGANGDLRPHLSAPGVNIRSSVPGGGYGLASGTSMAAPHVSGAAALLWSSAPALIGDITGTRELLASTATDTPDSTCGGTDADNNTYGEGRLNAHLAVGRAPRGKTGVLTGVVRDAASGQPLLGVKVAATEIEGSQERSTISNNIGGYRITLPVGDHKVSASAFGFDSTDPVTVSIREGETIDLDLALAARARVAVHGTIRDGSGQGWPLYARVVVDGVPGGTFFTKPSEGRYSFELPANATYTLRVTSELPGYEPLVTEVAVGQAEEVRRDFALAAETEECRASGYRKEHLGLFEPFDAAAVPAGWSSTSEIGEGWRFDDPGARTNLTGGTGNFASVDSTSGSLLEKATLTTPLVDLTGVSDPVLAFRTDLIRQNLGSVAVELSMDAGATWEAVWQRAQPVRGPQQVRLPIPAAAGQPDVQVRFRYDSGWTYDGWWQLDDVLIGRRVCAPLPGGLVVGTVADEVERTGVNGATVQSVGMPGESARTVATPDDAAQPDGVFWLFSSLTGKQPFRVSHGLEQYVERVDTVKVRAHDAARADLSLGVGRLLLRAEPVAEQVAPGSEKTVTIKVTNTGTAPATVRLTEWMEVDASTPVLSRWPSVAPQGPPVDDRGGPLLSPPANPSTLDAPAAAAESWNRLPDMAWPDMDGLAAVHNGKMYVVGGWALGGIGTTQLVQSYDMAAGTWSLNEVTRSPLRVARPAGGFVGDTLVVTGGWGRIDNIPTATTMLYHPDSNAWTLGADAPVRVAAAGHAILDGKLYVIGGRPAGNEEAASTAVAVYDPATDTWTRAADYPEPVAWQSCGTVGGEIYCAGGVTAGVQHLSRAYVYNPRANAWYRVADLPATVWGAGYSGANGKLLVSGGVVGGYRSGRGFAYDPATDRWSDLPPSQFALYRVGSTCGLYKVGGSEGTYGIKPYVEQLAGYSDCVTSNVDVPWLSAMPDTITVEPGKPAQVTIRLDARAVPGPGTYTARLLWHENTRYDVESIPVTMTVS